MAKKSAGILAYRLIKDRLEVFLVHPGGPFWKGKDIGAWSIPKGEYTTEEPLIAAKREFLEETGSEIRGTFIQLSPVKYKDGKVVSAWAVETDIDPTELKSNLFELEWPPKSGRMQSFAEVDKADWFSLNQAMLKIHSPLRALLEELQRRFKTNDGDKP